MKKEKIGLTTTNWILSILGILLLTCVIVLPPLFRAFIKDKVVEETPKEEIKIGTTTCRNKNIELKDYIDDETITFTYQDDKIQEYSKNIVRTYVDPLFYQEQKLIYGKYVTAFNTINGYSYSATPDDDIFSISIQEKYDLNSFQATTILIPGDENQTAVTTYYNLDDDINKVKNQLINNSYVCVDNE
jgi:hypothetical protein